MVTWWQTETGAIMILRPIPSVTATKPGSTAPSPCLALMRRSSTIAGRPVSGAQAGSYLVHQTLAAYLRTIWRDNERYLSTY